MYLESKKVSKSEYFLINKNETWIKMKLILILKPPSQFMKVPNLPKIAEDQNGGGWKKMNTMKQNHHDLHRDWTIITIDISYFSSSYRRFQQNGQTVAFF